jgi:integrase
LHRDYPLFPHQSGRWAKKVHGKLHYFGKIADDPKGEAAAKLWADQKDDLIAGRTPRSKREGLTVGVLCSKFLVAKRSHVTVGTLTSRSFVEYKRTTDLLVDAFGKNRLVEDIRPHDFEQLYHKLAARHGTATIGREITHCRSVFKYGMDSDLIERTIKFGPTFRGPSKAERRKVRAKQKHVRGARMFSAEEIKLMLSKAGPQLKAMILLGVNGGLGNTDCATLPLSALDLSNGWLDFPRVKTGIERKIPLWPETVEALKTVIVDHQQPSDEKYAGLVFLTRLGQPWVRYELTETKNEQGKLEVTGKADDAIAKAMRKLLNALRIYRRGVTFYALRHTFETIAGGSRDQVAVDAVMGHVDSTMAAEYREHIEDERLKAVVDHVRSWLYPPEAKRAKPVASKKRPEPRPQKESAGEVPSLRVVG